MQESGAKIIDIKLSITRDGGVMTSVYLILYEAEKPIT